MFIFAKESLSHLLIGHYMSLLDVILLAIALAMDCFAVSIVSGVIMRQIQWGTILRIAFLFGFFQAMMPLLGWLGFHYFASYIEAFDHWIAFGMLAFIGGKMIRDSFLPQEEHHFNPSNIFTQLSLAIATSIDALAIGISFACMSCYHTFSSMVLPLFIIFCASFLFAIVGHFLGIGFGKGISKKIKPELLGGIILILIGIKILITHLSP